MRKSRTTRDIGLRQVKNTTKWIAGMAAVVAGFITVWDAQALNHAGASTQNVTRPPTTTPSTSSSVGSGSSDGGYSDGGYSDPGSSGDSYSNPDSGGSLQVPDTTPAPSDQMPSASSGGS